MTSSSDLSSQWWEPVWAGQPGGGGSGWTGCALGPGKQPGWGAPAPVPQQQGTHSLGLSSHMWLQPAGGCSRAPGGCADAPVPTSAQDFSAGRFELLPGVGPPSTGTARVLVPGSQVGFLWGRAQPWESPSVISPPTRQKPVQVHGGRHTGLVFQWLQRQKNWGCVLKPPR